MEKIIIYEHNGKILIIANAIDVDLLCEYIHIVYDIPYPQCDFSYNVKNADIVPYGMTLYKNRFHSAKWFITHPLARREYRKICTFDFNNAMVALDGILNKQSI